MDCVLKLYIFYPQNSSKLLHVSMFLRSSSETLFTSIKYIYIYIYIYIKRRWIVRLIKIYFHQMCKCYKLVPHTHYMDKNLHWFNNLSMFCVSLIDVKKAHDDDLGNMETRRSFVAFCVKIQCILNTVYTKYSVY